MMSNRLLLFQRKYSIGRWTTLIGQIKAEGFHKYFFHPGKQKNYLIYTVAALFAKHSYHHLAHINNVQ